MKFVDMSCLGRMVTLRRTLWNDEVVEERMPASKAVLMVLYGNLNGSEVISARIIGDEDMRLWDMSV